MIRRGLGVAAVAAILGIAALLPLVRLVAAAAVDPASLAGALRPLELRAAANTGILAAGTTGFALLVGLPLGVLFARSDLPGIERWRALATLPYVLPPYAQAIAWIALCNPTTGWLNGPLLALGLPPLDIYGLGGMVWVMGLECAPLVMLATADALSRMDASLEEQARIAGASPLRVAIRITLPLAAPAILASTSFVFSSSAAAFGVPYLLASGAPDPDWVLTTRIAQALDLDPAAGRSRAVALSLLLLIGAVAIPALGARLGRGSWVTVGGKATRPTRLALGRLRPWASALVGGFVLLGVVLPLGTLIGLSVTDQLGRGLHPSNLSLESYAAILGRPRELGALARSAWLAAGAATAAVAVGSAVAWLELRAVGGRWLGRLARAPYAVPGTVLALGLLLTWSQEIRLILFERATLVLALADTGWLLMLAYAVKLLALPVGGIGAALRSIDPALEEAARVSGASEGRALLRIVAPILLPSAASSWLLVFLPAFTEVTMSVLLGGPQTRVVGVLLFDLQTYGDPPAAAALAVVVSAAVVALHAAARRWGG